MTHMPRSERRARLLLICITLLVTGCRTPKNDTSMLALRHEDVQTFVHPELAQRQHRTFSIAPALGGGTSSIVNAQIALFIRSALEARGYVYEPDSVKADMLVFASSRTDVQSTYIPPQTIDVDVWVPSRTLQSTESISGRATYDGTSTDYYSGRVGSTPYSGSTFGYQSGSASISGSRTTTTTVPGYTRTEQRTVPGRTVRANYTTADLRIYDVRQNQPVFVSTVYAETRSADSRVACQSTFRKALEQLPRGGANTFDLKRTLGFGISIITLDGNRYFPLVNKVADDGLGEAAGLRDSDFLMEIDGETTSNLPYSAVHQRLAKAIDGQISLSVYRAGERLNIQLAAKQK